MAEYLLFPKMCGLSERAWNASPAWGTDPDGSGYRQALRRYNARIASVEMPRLAALGVNFRVSPPGLKLQDGMLRANSPSPVQRSAIRSTAANRPRLPPDGPLPLPVRPPE